MDVQRMMRSEREADIAFELQAAVAFFSSSWSEFLLPP